MKHAHETATMPAELWRSDSQMTDTSRPCLDQGQVPGSPQQDSSWVDDLASNPSPATAEIIKNLGEVAHTHGGSDVIQRHLQGVCCRCRGVVEWLPNAVHTLPNKAVVPQL